MCSAFDLFVDSCFEVTEGPQSNVGVTQLLELNAFWSTKTRSHQDVVSQIENLGGMIQCISTRENILYCVDILRENAEKGLEILADTVLNPIFPEEEIEDSKEVVVYSKNELPAEVLSRDAIQLAAYKGPLGNHHYCPDDQLSHLTPAKIKAFHNDHFFGSNCILSGSGIEHDVFVNWSKKIFSALPKTCKGHYFPRLPSRYTGGLYVNQREMKEPFVRVAMGFEVGGWKDAQLVPASVMQQLLGGGSSFSAGGPGKGMYTRLYRETLCCHAWVESAEAFILINDESGILGIDGGCPPAYVQSMIREIVAQLTRLSVEPVKPEDLSRAKNMLKSMMMMQLESRLVICEDIARQFAAYGERRSPASLCAKIDAVTAQDLMDVAKRMLKSKPAIGVVGHDLSNVPPYEVIQQFTQKMIDDLDLVKDDNSVY